jgi:hypothetical protein
MRPPYAVLASAVYLSLRKILIKIFASVPQNNLDKPLMYNNI